MADCNGNKAKFVSLDSENVGKKYLERVTHIENHLENFCSVFSGYNVKIAQLRDKNDEIAKCLHKFAAEEPFETTTKLTVQLLSQIVATVGDYRDAEVERLEGKVLLSLTSYGEIFKFMKSDIRKSMAASKKESERRKDLEKFLTKRKDSKYHEAIGLAENALERALTESSHLNEQIQEQMIKFEHKRLVDVKESLEKFLRVEIAASAKLVELFTEAFQTVHSIDIETDLEIIREGLKLPPTVSLLQTKSSSNKTKGSSASHKNQTLFINTGVSHSARNRSYKNLSDKTCVPIKVSSETCEMMGTIRKKAKEICQRNKANNCFNEQGNLQRPRQTRSEGRKPEVSSSSESEDDKDGTEWLASFQKQLDLASSEGKITSESKKEMSRKYANEVSGSTSPVSEKDNVTGGAKYNSSEQNGKVSKEKEERRGFVYEGNTFPVNKTFKIETTRKDGSHKKLRDDSNADLENFRVKKRVSFGESDSEAECSKKDRENNYKRALSPAPNNKRSVLKK